MGLSCATVLVSILVIWCQAFATAQFADPRLRISRAVGVNVQNYTLSDAQPLTLDVLANHVDVNLRDAKLLSFPDPTPMGSTTLRISREQRDMVVYVPSLASLLSGDAFSYRIEKDQQRKSTGYVILWPVITGWWKMDETSGKTVSDSSRNGATGDIKGSETWDQGLVFGGATTVALGTKPSLSGKTSFSLSVWVKVNSASRAVIMQQRSKSTSTTNGYNGEYMLYLASGGKPSLMVYGDGGYQFEFSSGASINDEQWHHIAAVRAGTEGFIYVDGRLSAAATGSLRNLDDNIPVAMGGDVRDDRDYFKGTLSSVRIFNRALTPAEVGYLSTFPEALVGLWRMDERTGSSVWDSSGNLATGTIIRSATWDDSGGLTFKGDGKVSFGTAPSLGGRISFSVHVWIKVPTSAPSSSGTIIQQRSQSSSQTSGYNGEYVLNLKDGSRPNFWLYGDGEYQFDITSSVPINDGKWHHVIAVREGSEGRLYIDGVLSAKASGTVRSLDAKIGVHMGWDERDDKSFLIATLKDVRIYNRVILSRLDAPPVLEEAMHMTSGDSWFTNNLVQTG